MHNINKSQLPSLSLRFRNIGPVKDADLELGDLTIVAGRNNTGKTYVVYTLYGFLKMWRSWIDKDFILGSQGFSEARFPGFRSISDTILRDGSIAFPLHDKELQYQRHMILRGLASRFSERALSGVFNSWPDVFAKSSIEATAKQQNIYEIHTKEYAIHNLLEDIDMSIEYNGEQVRLTVKPSERKLEPDYLQFRIVHFYFDFLLHNILPAPFILSSERFGISLFYKELDFNKNQLVDLLQKLGDKDKNGDIPTYELYELIDGATSRYALPIKDNIDYTRSIQNRIGRKSDVFENKLFDLIETMMEGYYRTSRDSIRFMSRDRKKRGFDVPLHLASSSARGLSDLYFFSRHVARRNNILMIDEPESHLDTANQILLARLLARFVHAGVKVLVTTHSDYLIKEINNLVMLSSSFPERDSVMRRLGYTANDFLKPDSVRAYVAEHNSLSKCSVDEFGMDMPIFDATIDDINRVANELASRLTEYETV